MSTCLGLSIYSSDPFWVVIPSMREERAFAASAVVEDTMYVLGGYSDR